jgi:uncharacterized membrane protein YfcA
MGAVLLLLATRIWLELAGISLGREIAFSPRIVVSVALVVGVISGIYGTGGGSLMAPFLVAVLGLSIASVRGATLTSTFLTSLVGISTFLVLGATPRWGLGLLFGIGGLAGSYSGARFQERLQGRTIKIMLAVLVTMLGINYILQGLGVI